MFKLSKEKSEKATWAVAVHLSKGEISTITLSWRAKSTKDEAIAEALVYAGERKPGFKVEQYLVEKIG